MSGELQVSLDKIVDIEIFQIGKYKAESNKGVFRPQLSDFGNSDLVKVNDPNLPLGSFT